MLWASVQNRFRTEADFPVSWKTCCAGMAWTHSLPLKTGSTSSKKLWYQIRSCIIDEKEFPRVYEWASQQNFGGRWMQECSNRYELFYREYYWSPAYKSYDVSGLTKRDIYDNITNLFISHVELTSIGYLWEAEEDHSKDKSCFCLMPSLQLFDGMGMQYSDEDGVFLNKDGEAICFDVSAIERSNNNLLIRKDALLETSC